MTFITKALDAVKGAAGSLKDRAASGSVGNIKLSDFLTSQSPPAGVSKKLDHDSMFGNWIGGDSAGAHLGSTLVAGSIGGASNMLLGGDFSGGFVAGGAVGLAGRSMVKTTKGMQDKFYAPEARETWGGDYSTLNPVLKTIKDKEFITSRSALYAGSALGGGIFGGSGRPSHRRGFNANRGNRI